MSHCRTQFALICVLAWAVLGVTFAATTVGTAIVNQATLTYRDASTGEAFELLSNTSRILVSSLKRFELLSPQTRQAAAGDEVSIAHQLHNTGNVADVYRLSVENVLADSADLDDLRIVVDDNNNGVADTGESVVTDAMTLEPDQQVNLVVTGRVPESVAGDDIIELLVHAETLDGESAAQSNRDRIDIVPNANLTLTLTNTPDCSSDTFPGARIDYQLQISNDSETLPLTQQIMVNGLPRRGVLVQMEVPSSMKLLNSELPPGSTPDDGLLVQAWNGGDDWVTAAQWDDEQRVARLGMLLQVGQLAQGVLITRNFALQAPDSATGTPIEIVTFVDLDGDNRADAESSSACNIVGEPAAALPAYIRFVEPPLSLQRAGAAPQFARDEDFVDTRVYRHDGFENYELTRDGVYLELQADVSPSLLQVGTDGVDHVLVELESYDRFIWAPHRLLIAAIALAAGARSRGSPTTPVRLGLVCCKARSMAV